MTDPESQWPPPVFAPPSVGGLAAGASDELPVELPVSSVVVVDTPPKRSKGKFIGGAVAVTALLGAGVFAVASLAGREGDGGAASPTEVGTKLTDALSNEDVLGVIDLLLPGERETFRQPLIDVIDNLRRIEVLDAKASLSKVGGLDLVFTDVKVTPTPTNVDDVTNIEITGQGTASLDGKQVPIGSLLIEEAFDGKRPNLDRAEQTNDVDVKMTTVQRGGRWYLSAFYTAAERARGDRDIPAKGVAAAGAESPEKAVEEMLAAISDQSLETGIALLNPNEAEALQRYAPIFLTDSQQQLDDAKLNWKISDTTFTTEGSGSRRSVAITGFHFTAKQNDSKVDISLKDGCLVIVSDSSTNDSCKSGSSLDDVLAQSGLDQNESLTKLIDSVKTAFSDFHANGIAVNEVAGSWYVSPIGSLSDLLVSGLASLDKVEIKDIIKATRDFSESNGLG